MHCRIFFLVRELERCIKKYSETDAHICYCTVMFALHYKDKITRNTGLQKKKYQNLVLAWPRSKWLTEPLKISTQILERGGQVLNCRCFKEFHLHSPFAFPSAFQVINVCTTVNLLYIRNKYWLWKGIYDRSMF